MVQYWNIMIAMVVLIICSPVAHADENRMSPELYDTILNAERDTEDQIVGVLAAIIQGSPPKARYQLLINVAQGLQNTTYEKRINAYKRFNDVANKLTTKERRLILGHVERTLAVFAPAEQEIIYVQIQKLIQEIKLLPKNEGGDLLVLFMDAFPHIK